MKASAISPRDTSESVRLLSEKASSNPSNSETLLRRHLIGIVHLGRKYVIFIKFGASNEQACPRNKNQSWFPKNSVRTSLSALVPASFLNRFYGPRPKSWQPLRATRRESDLEEMQKKAQSAAILGATPSTSLHSCIGPNDAPIIFNNLLAFNN
jgi:hypothetical protein